MFLKMYLSLWPSSLLRLIQFPLSLLNRSYVVAGIAAAVVGIAWQLLGQRLNVSQPSLYSGLVLFIYLSSAGCFSDRWIKWLAWFVVGWYQVHHKWQCRGRNPRRIPEGRLSCSFSYLILTNQPTTSAAQRRSVQDCNVLSLGCRRNQPCTCRRTPKCARG